MGMPVPTLIALLAIGIIILIMAVVLFLRILGDDGGRKQKKKDRSSLVKEANRKLQQNPKDPEALRTLADVYYDDQDWDKAMKTYGILMDLVATQSEINEYEVTLRHGIAALQLKHYEDAYKSLVVARSLEGDDFELHYNLGYLEMRRQNYEKAASLLQAAYEQKPDHVQTHRYLGQTYYRTKQYKEAINALRPLVDAHPDDKESIFIMAHAYYELGQQDQARRLFSHLRPDPTYGPRASLMAGSIQMKNRQFDQAREDFELGLKHEQVQQEVALELKYRLAAAYTKLQDVEQALPLLEEIYQIRPDYKDVGQQLAKNRELNNNRNLQVFLIAPASEFVALCRKLTSSFFPKSSVKITDISVNKNEYADILAEVETSTWIDIILFRYIRTTGQVGELLLRDLHSRIKDLKAGRGFCVTAGGFTEGAQQFVEARLIDLVEKNELMKLLSRVG
jgi:tetratricopeptide (TPR) repeat protein